MLPRIIVAASIWAVALSAVSQVVENKEQLKRAYFRIKVLAESTKEVRAALNLLDRSLKIAMPSSMVKASDLEKIIESTDRLRKMEVPELPILFSQRQIGSYSKHTPGSNPLHGSQEMKRRMRADSDVRRKEIESLIEQRNRLVSLRNEMQSQADTAALISVRLSKAIGADVEIISRFTGHSIIISAIDFDGAVIPTLEERVQIANKLVKKYTDTIKFSSTDLKNFEDGIAVFQFFSHDALPPGAVIEQGIGGGESVAIREMQSKLSDASRIALVHAETSRLAAQEIRKQNSESHALSSLIDFVGSAATFASAAFGSGDSDVRSDSPSPSARTPPAPSSVSRTIPPQPLPKPIPKLAPRSRVPAVYKDMHWLQGGEPSAASQGRAGHR